MATIKAFLDTRKNGGDANKSATLKLAIAHRKSTAYIVLNITLLPGQWEAKAREVINHPEKKTLNSVIRKKVVEAETALLKLSDECDINSLSATELRGRILEMTRPKSDKPVVKEDNTTLGNVFDRCMELKQGGTKNLYKSTRNRLNDFKTKEVIDKMHFEDITPAWLTEFDIFLAKQAPSANARAIHMRNLRTVCNFAIDNGITTHYPFRRFRIKHEKTRKRNFDVETLRKIFNHQCEEEWQQKYLDFFKLSFMLLGINVVDLCNLKDVDQGYIGYKRAKTRKQYNVKVEPEALAIIDRYRGKKQLLCFLDSYQNYRHFYNNLCKGLKEVRDQLGLKELTSYWARHSWATIAASLDIPKDTIAAALGHGENTVTDIYIEFDMKKVDEANRKVLDWVLYGKKCG